MQDVPDDFAVLTEARDDRVVLALRGELDMASLPVLRDAVETLRASGSAPSRVVVDLRELAFLDSMGLEFLLRLGDDVELELIRGPRQVQRLFDVMGLNEVLTFVEPPAS